jgi:DsbC/DsbD-like thiol-disulfide interchange protein
MYEYKPILRHKKKFFLGDFPSYVYFFLSVFGLASFTNESIADQSVVKVSIVDPPKEVANGTGIGVQFVIQDGWHIYGKEAGELGLPTKILVEGGSVGDYSWPPTEVFKNPGVPDSFGYHGTVVVGVGIEGGDEVIGKEVSVKAKWLACSKDACIPSSTSIKGVVKKVENQSH